ncbi:sugar ABC transporter substrate-binding protein [Streptomyces sp. M19]
MPGRPVHPRLLRRLRRHGGGRTTLDYWLWDDKQMPAYQECATAFEQANPDIKVEITQTAWGQYWQSLAMQVVSDDAPDVWTNQSSYYPQYATTGQLLDLQPLVERDKVDLSAYQPGLADPWVRSGKRYGLPRTGTPWRWSTTPPCCGSRGRHRRAERPDLEPLRRRHPGAGHRQGDGRHQGRDGLDPDFDKNHVKTYGFLAEWADGSQGQNGWGDLAAANGFSYLDTNPWGTHYKYDDPALAETIGWFRHLIDEGYTPRFDKQSTIANSELLMAGKGAIMVTGSWTISTFTDPKVRQKFAFAPLPTGPAGRKSALNGLSDSIWSGTRHREEAWKWVKFLASPDCQNLVARRNVAFPALRSATSEAVAAHRAKGHDVHVFTDALADKDGTFMLPVTEHGTEINPIVQDAVQSAILGTSRPEAALKKANDKVNDLFK